MTFLYALRLNARRFPTKPAVVFEGRSQTYTDFLDRVERMMTVLARRGIGLYHAGNSSKAHKKLVWIWRDIIANSNPGTVYLGDKKLGLDSVFLEFDTTQRQSYEQRAQSALGVVDGAKAEGEK